MRWRAADPKELERSASARAAAFDAEDARRDRVRLDADAKVDGISAPEAPVDVKEPRVGGVEPAEGLHEVWQIQCEAVLGRASYAQRTRLLRRGR